MATTTQTVRTCDVFGTTKDVRRYTIKVIQIDPVQENDSDVLAPPVDCNMDLSMRAVKRLKKFVERGLTAPK